MDTDDDKEAKPAVSGLASGGGAAAASGPADSGAASGPVKLKDEVKDEPMEIESAASEKKTTVEKEKRAGSSVSPGDDSDVLPMVNGTLSDSDKEQDITVRSVNCSEDVAAAMLRIRRESS